MPFLSGKLLDMAQKLSQIVEATQDRYDYLNGYYYGQQHLRQLGLAIPPELTRFTVIVNWPRVVADSRVDRLDLKGFRVGDNDKLASAVWRLWQEFGLSEDQSSYLDFELFGRSFKTVEKNNDGDVVIHNVSPEDITAIRSPLDNRLAAAYQRLSDENNMTVGRIFWTRQNTYYMDESWRIQRVETNEIGLIPVIPAYRNRRTSLPKYQNWPRMQGISAIMDTIDMTDACARDLTNAQLAQETHAVPQRGILGASKGDFVDQNGKPLTVWETYFGRVWALKNENAKTFEFSSANMTNFTSMVELYARLVSGSSGLPPNYFGLAADDAASADAIRSREAKLVKSIERDQRSIGDQAKETARIAIALMQGVDAARKFDQCEALWHDAGTPTVAQRADAVTKLYAATDSSQRALLPREMAWEELGWSPEKIARAKALLKAEEQEQMELYLKPEADNGDADAGPTEQRESADEASSQDKQSDDTQNTGSVATQRNR
jgi:hypothetical protein